MLVIKGVRRCGKSTLLINEMKRLVASGVAKEQLLFVNFEDVRLIGHLGVELLGLIKDTYMEFVNPQGKPYIFLDEVQNIEHWEKWVNTEYELKKSYVYVTGSNSSMLNSEIGTALSGRYVSVNVYPLSFKEFLLFKEVEIKNKMELISQKNLLNREFRAFISEGGFPKSIEFREKMIESVANTVAVDGKLLLVAHKKKLMVPGPPWPLNRDEVDLFKGHLTEIDFDVHASTSMFALEQFRVVYRRN